MSTSNVGSDRKTMVSRVRVSDYDAWRKGFDSFEQRRADSGIRNQRIYCNVDDRTDVVILFDIDNPETAQAFFANAETQKAMKECGGLLGPPVISFL
jgi:hypothetical protein